MPRQMLPLVLSSGIDRATGIPASDPSTPRDIRNVYPRLGKAEVRKGYTEASALVRDATPQDHIIGGRGLRSERIGIVLGYETASRKVNVFRTASDGSAPEFVGTIWTLPSGAPLPKVILTDSYGKIFIAHDEPALGYRQSTIVYDSFGTDFLTPLTADLDGNGDKPVKFRGVVRHLSYLFGWGYGSDSENRPDMVRASLPSQPTVFRPEHYFFTGQRGDPVVTCQPAGSVLLAFKEGETYKIVGHSRDTFGIVPSDPLYGCVAGRLAVSIAGNVFFWSEEGPRLTTGGQSEDLAIPLDLDAPQPSDLVAEGVVEDGFAEYLPGKRVVLFVFDRRVYALSLWGGEPRWGYLELGAAPYCAFRLYGGESQNVVTGYPQYDSADTEQTTATIHWTNIDADGDEIVEIWIKPAGGSWSRADSVAVGGATQSHQITDLTSGTVHDAALRYRRGTSYSPNSADDSDPSLWPAAQQGQFTTAGANSPTLDSVDWSRVSSTQEKNALAWTNDNGDDQIRIYRKKNAGAFTLIDTVAAGTTTYDDVSDDEGLGDPNAEWGENEYTYYVVHWNGSVEGEKSNEITVWAGPTAPTFDDLTAPGSNRYDVYWTDTWGSGTLEIWDNYDDAGGTTNPDPDVLRATDAIDGLPAVRSVQLNSQASGVDIGVKIRGREETFTVTDYSEFSPTFPVTIVG